MALLIAAPLALVGHSTASAANGPTVVGDWAMQERTVANANLLNNNTVSRDTDLTPFNTYPDLSGPGVPYSPMGGITNEPNGDPNDPNEFDNYVGVSSVPLGQINPDTWNIDLTADATDLPGAEVTFTWTVIPAPPETCDLVKAADDIVGGAATVCGGIAVIPAGSATEAVTGGAAAGSVNVDLPAGRHVVVVDTGIEDVVSAYYVEPKDFLVAIMGDSYGSGEGNPEHLQRALDQFNDARDGTLEFADPADHTTFGIEGSGWTNVNCHRSTLGGQAQAALALEQADPHSSVTTLYVSCSGAKIDEGILGVKKGWVDVDIANPEVDIPEKPQIIQVQRLAQGRQVDAAMMSIGGNDAGFVPLVVECLASANCYNNDDGSGETLHDRTSDKLANLVKGRLPLVNNCLTGSADACELLASHGNEFDAAAVYGTTDGLAIPADNVFYTEYPDLTSRFLPDGSEIEICNVAELALDVEVLRPYIPGPTPVVNGILRQIDELDGTRDGFLTLPPNAVLPEAEFQWASEFVLGGTQPNRDRIRDGGTFQPVDRTLVGPTDTTTLTYDTESLDENVLASVNNFGWSAVETFEGSAGHGLCNFINGAGTRDTGTWAYLVGALNGDSVPSGAAHPNEYGQENYRNQAIPVATAALSADGFGTPTEFIPLGDPASPPAPPAAPGPQPIDGDPQPTLPDTGADNEGLTMLALAALAAGAAAIVLGGRRLQDGRSSD